MSARRSGAPRTAAVVTIALIPALGLAAVWNWARDEVRSIPVVTVPSVVPGDGSSVVGVPEVQALSFRRVPTAVIAEVQEQESAARLAGVVDSVPEGACLAVGGQPGIRVEADGGVNAGALQRIIVAAAALEVLGADHHFSTSLHADGLEGPVIGDLYIIGGGDPMLATSSFADAMRSVPHWWTPVEALADALVLLGVERIAGDVVADGSRYDDDLRPSDWPASVSLTEAGRVDSLVVDRGRLSTSPRNVAFDPVQAAARTLVDLLRARGVVVEGFPRTGTMPPDVPPVATVRGEPLSRVLAGMLNTDDADIAEFVLKEIGVRVSGRGTRIAGVEAIADVVASWGSAGVAMTDGSGLGPENRVSCGALLAAWERARDLLPDGNVPFAAAGDVLGAIDDRPPVAAVGSASVIADALRLISEPVDRLSIGELSP